APRCARAPARPAYAATSVNELTPCSENEPDPLFVENEPDPLFVELNPVRAHLAASPGDYRWSSYRYNADGHPDRILTPHPEYQALGRSDVERTAAYTAFVRECIGPAEDDSLRLTTQQQRAWGPERFKSQIEALTLRAVHVRPRGRPPRAPQHRQ
ncbi:hypothetical protein ACFOEA_01090, partial [Coralloluteibacterium stylophorae]